MKDMSTREYLEMMIPSKDEGFCRIEENDSDLRKELKRAYNYAFAKKRLEEEAEKERLYRQYFQSEANLTPSRNLNRARKYPLTEEEAAYLIDLYKRTNERGLSGTGLTPSRNLNRARKYPLTEEEKAEIQELYQKYIGGK